MNVLNREIKNLSDEIDARIKDEIERTPWGQMMDLQSIRDEYKDRIDDLYSKIEHALRDDPQLRYTENGFLDERR